MKTTRKRFRSLQDEGCAVGDRWGPDAGQIGCVHHTMIAAWKRQAVDDMARTFSSAGEATKPAGEAELEKLHARIGQLIIERDFLAKASGR